jgi:Capsule assembly protein Wzi
MKATKCPTASRRQKISSGPRRVHRLDRKSGIRPKKKPKDDGAKVESLCAYAGPPSMHVWAFACVLAMMVVTFIRPVNAAPPGTGSGSRPQMNGSGAAMADCGESAPGSPYIPVDSWIYPAVLRLYSLGFVEHAYLGLRPWTRASLSNMLEGTGDAIGDAGEGPGANEARKLYEALDRELALDSTAACQPKIGSLHVESSYSVLRAISGTPLRDSFHLGSTVVNDYGRPYENGLNNYTGASGYAVAGRFTLYLRGEFQGAPSAAGYSVGLAQALSTVDETTYTDPQTNITNYYLPQPTIPQGPIATATDGRFLEAYLSYQFLSHVISFGKQDEWLGPAQGASMAYSNNAENIYAFHINRIEPLYIPGLSWITGPFRYEFLVGRLRGHTLIPNNGYAGSPTTEGNVLNPGDPFVHVEKINFCPTRNIELGFERTVLWAGEGHAPATLHTFLNSFFSTSSPGVQKFGRDDPGARFASFDFSYRLPFLRNWLMLYSDSEVHDDVSPIDNPRHAAYRPGLYLSHVPAVPKLDIRVEGVSTDPSDSRSTGGLFMYWEEIEREGYTNQGQLFGDWIGREDKGGQAWITYHLSGNEWIQAEWRNQKADKDFIPGSTTRTVAGTKTLIPGGTTLNDISFQAVKRIGKDFEVNGNFDLERWKAPIDLPGLQTVTATTIQLTWFPGRTVSF